jgi:NAD(P)-dependent dehydrogenase (short-subunit alcohol dehydrogenase family)
VSIQDNRLQGRVAFVTGGGSGIGAATAKRLAQAGAAVFVTDVDAASAERIAAEIRQAGGRSKAAEHDVTDEAQWERVVGAMSSRCLWRTGSASKPSISMACFWVLSTVSQS